MANVPKGWKLVPIEPDEAMAWNAFNKAGKHLHTYNGWFDPAAAVYRAMIAKAPRPPHEAATLLASQEAEIAELRETNRKLHRRVQIAEGFMQSAEDIPNGWLRVLKDRVSLQDIIQRTIVDEIAKAKKKAEARADLRPAETGEPT